MKKNAKIYLAGHTGLVGANLLIKLRENGFKNIITTTHKQLDLINQFRVENFFKKNRPEYVFLSAAKVGGIYANSNYPAQFIYENIAIQTNVIHFSYKYRVKKLLFFASACSYPRKCLQPMKEKYLLSGYLEPTNEPYAIAKIAGIKMCQAYNQQYGTNFICAIPTNTYGPNDNFDFKDAHVIPSLIRRIYEAKINRKPDVEIWGSGRPLRDFLYVDDLGSAALFLMRNYNSKDIINIGSGNGVSVRELVDIIKNIIGYQGKIIFDRFKPDGAPKKVLDVSKINHLGWKAKTPLAEGVRKTYEWFIRHLSNL